MNPVAAALDRMVTPAASGASFGYHDSQPASSYEPVVEHSRQTLHEFLAHVQRHGGIDTVLQIGLGRRGGTHRAFRLLGKQVVTVERDAARVRAFVADELGMGVDLGVAADQLGPEWGLVVGDSLAPQTVLAVQARLPACDLLFLDGGDTYRQCKADWLAYEPMVRPGGLVAIVDRSQVWPSTRRPFDVDRFAFDLERHHLLPRGVRLARFGTDDAIHCYQKPRGTRVEPPTVPLPLGFVEVPAARRLTADWHGFSLHAAPAGHVAVADPVEVYDERARLRNEYRVVLQHPERAGLEALVGEFVRARPLAGAVLDCLSRGDRQGFERLGAEVGEGREAFAAALLPSLSATPDNAELLRVFGAWQLLGGQYDVGAAVLRRLLAQQLTDSECLMALAQVHMHLRRDEVAARQLLSEVRSRIRQIDVERICHGQLSGHALWAHPRCLRGIRRCLWVGNGAEAGAKAWGLLRLGPFRALSAGAAAAEGPAAGAPAAEPSVAGSAGVREVFFDQEHDLVAYHRWSVPFAARQPGRSQRPLGSVVTTTLDELVRQGLVQTAEAQLLVIDAPGEELAILRAAGSLLPHVELLCVTVYHQSVFVGGQPDRELVACLEQADMVFLGSEPTRVDCRSQALFRRMGVEGR